MARYLPPVHSPLPARAIGAGAAALAAGAARAEAIVLDRLRQHFGLTAILRTDSGTSALTLALRSVAGERPGRPIALPAYCCYDIATAADGAGIPVRLYDTDPATLGPDLESLRRALTAGAAGIVIAHLYGVPVDMDAVMVLAGEHGARVIDDAAQGAGTTYQGKAVGAFGAFGVLSFGRGKGITGSGGGALLGNDDAGARALAELRRTLAAPSRGTRALAAAAAQSLLARPALYGIPSAVPFLRLGETRYREPALPAAPSVVSSAILAATWPLAAAESEVRRRHAARLLDALEGERRRWAVRAPERGRAGYLRLPLVLPAPARARAAGARRLGIMPGYPTALIDLPGFGARTLAPSAAYPGARLLAERLCTLPTHSQLNEDDLRRLEEWLGSASQ